MLATRAAIEAAARRIAGVARVTPALDLTPLAPLVVKCEQMQPIGAFKVRGAVNFMAQLPEAQLRAGVITYSSGNHGQAVAFAAQRMGTHAVVVMPETAPLVKVEGARAWGAEVLFAGTTTVHRQARAEEEAARRGLTIVPPFDCLRIIEGQGTAGLEILTQVPGVRAVYAPIGGGGLISGIAAAVKLSDPSIRVIGVEPAGAPKMSKSLAAGRPVTLDRVASAADGLLAVRRFSEHRKVGLAVQSNGEGLPDQRVVLDEHYCYLPGPCRLCQASGEPSPAAAHPIRRGRCAIERVYRFRFRP